MSDERLNRNILGWLEQISDSETENERNEPELPNEDCSDIEDVPVDSFIRGECQSDSEIEDNNTKCQDEDGTNIEPPLEDDRRSTCKI